LVQNNKYRIKINEIQFSPLIFYKDITKDIRYQSPKGTHTDQNLMKYWTDVAAM